MSNASLTRLHPLAGILMAGILGAIIGGAGFLHWFKTRDPDNMSNWIEAGQWETASSIGAASADPITRALVARFGLLAMSSDETMYFFTANDSTGDRLIDSCSYEIVGTDPATRWWSVTLYDKDSFLVDNGQNAFSMDKTRLTRTDGQNFRIAISNDNDGAFENWISNSGAGEFMLTLRLYNPDEAVIANPSGTVLPTVSRISCKGDQA